MDCHNRGLFIKNYIELPEPFFLSRTQEYNNILYHVLKYWKVLYSQIGIGGLLLSHSTCPPGYEYDRKCIIAYNTGLEIVM